MHRLQPEHRTMHCGLLPGVEYALHGSGKIPSWARALNLHHQEVLDGTVCEAKQEPLVSEAVAWAAIPPCYQALVDSTELLCVF